MNKDNVIKINSTHKLVNGNEHIDCNQVVLLEMTAKDRHVYADLKHVVQTSVMKALSGITFDRRHEEKDVSPIEQVDYKEQLKILDGASIIRLEEILFTGGLIKFYLGKDNYSSIDNNHLEAMFMVNKNANIEIIGEYLNRFFTL